MKTKIIAEIGYNHNGSIEIAKEMIDEASKLNLWAVKFQKWNIEGFPDEIKNKIRNSPHDYGKTYYDHRKFLEFNIEELKELKKYAEQKKLQFISSGKDFFSVRQLAEKLNCQIIKLPSQRYLDHDIFIYLYNERKKRNFAIAVSTGMHKQKEIMNSRWIDDDGANIIMHCISQYPAKLEDCNLGWMAKAGIYNGYSSHEIEGKAIKYAVSMGAIFIERHFTLDKKSKGSDHIISSDVKEMKKIIKSIEEIEEIMGTGKRKISKEELKLGRYYRSF